MTNPASRSIYSRVVENAIKLAMVYAISIDHRKPVIDSEAFAWGRDFALWSANTLMEQLNRFMADNENESRSKRLERLIYDAGAKGIKRGDLTQGSRWLKSDQERKELIDDLLVAGLIRVEELKADGAGRPGKVLIHNSR
jgi:hypothetical protein